MLKAKARTQGIRLWVVPAALLLFALLTVSAALAGLPAQQGLSSPSSAEGCCSQQLYYQDYSGDGSYTDSYTDTSGYVAQAADDFVVPQGQTWAIEQVSARLQTCCPNSVTLYFYNNVMSGTQDLPGTLVYSKTFNYSMAAPNGEGAPDAASDSSYFFGSNTPMVELGQGHYWLSVQGGNWPLHWSNANATSNSPAAWRNPSGPPAPTNTPAPTATDTPMPGAPYGATHLRSPYGATVCADWGTRSTDCGLNPQAPDQRFAIYGVIDQNLPTPVVEACGLDWRIVPSQNYTDTTSSSSNGTNVLEGVAAVSGTDGWAVGSWLSATTLLDSTFGLDHDRGSAPSAPSASFVPNSGYTLIERWDGDSFDIFPSPVIIDGKSSERARAPLHDVDAASASDVWAVGEYSFGSTREKAQAPEGGSNNQTLTMHFDGADWSVEDSPNYITGTAHYLYGVDAESANEAWAVGTYSSPVEENSGNRTLVMRWNGSSWALMDTPNYTETTGCCYYNYLRGVSAVPGTNEVWAVGGYYSAPNYDDRALTMHYDGATWQLVENPFTSEMFTGSNSFAYLNGVYAVASDDVWAVGTQMHGVASNYESRNLVIHWDGESWSEVEAPNRAGSNELFGIKAISPNDMWAVGVYGQGVNPTAPGDASAPGGTELSPLTLHWDGTGWQDVSNPQLEYTRRDFLMDVDGVATDNLLAVGYSQENSNEWSNDTTLAEQYSNPCPEVAPSPSATAAASPTPVTCDVRDFPDVPPGSTFYPYVRCLVCKGVVSGFPDGTFKPGLNVTRQQLAKIVSNAAGFDDTIPVRHTFADVPYSTDVNSYWIYIERLFAHGVIDGYECGGTNSQTGEAEPCDTERRPYFRPLNTVTRGQASKMVSEAAGFDEEIATGQQTYEDVPSTGEGSTFWVFIERLSARGVMGGYPCGTAPAGSCRAGGRPYFLPNAPLSRGQAAKIVSNTFFPNCQTVSPSE